jgi:hypothetical protein
VFIELFSLQKYLNFKLSNNRKFHNVILRSSFVLQISSDISQVNTPTMYIKSLKHNIIDITALKTLEPYEIRTRVVWSRGGCDVHFATPQVLHENLHLKHNKSYIVKTGIPKMTRSMYIAIRNFTFPINETHFQ